jgi:hypothetical protein
MDQVHAGRIEGGGHSNLGALSGPLVQEFQPSIAQVLETDTSYLDALHRY